MSKKLSISYYVEGIKQGNIAVLSRAITLIESKNREHQAMAQELLDILLPLTGNSQRIGITGVPGVGKSTFIESFGMHLIRQNKKVAVLAIDPSSSISGGSILGDKTRMDQLSVQKNAFIRPSASRGSLGGVTYKTYEALLLCEAAGFDTIIVETVGVGQSETEVSHICDFFLLLMLAGAGDELQGIKRGIMEMADGMIITKADGQNVDKAKMARNEYARALHFFPPHPSGWKPEVKVTSSYDQIGIKEVDDMIQKYFQHQTINGFIQENRNQQNLFAFKRLINEQLHQYLLGNDHIQEAISEAEKNIKMRKVTPFSASSSIIKQIFESSKS